jgi:predicted aspartyl protease
VLTRLAAVAILLNISSPVAASDRPWVPLSVDANGAVVVPIGVNGRGPFLFLLDTGSSHSVVSRSLAGHLGLRHVARTTVLTSTGSELRGVVRLDLTTIGTARSEGLLASVVPLEQLSALARGIEGIIGQDFLLGFNYTLDYRRRRLTWNDDSALEDGTRLPLVAQGGRYLVKIEQGGHESPMLLVPDSGSNGLVMFARAGYTRVPLQPAAHPTAVHSLSGRQDARAMMLRELNLGDVTIRDQRVAVVARDPADVLEGDGLLPLHLFASVTFNARALEIIVRER